MDLLLDTSVLSETRKSRPNAEVFRFLEQVDPKRTYLSALTLGELRRGAAALRDRNPQGERALSLWIDRLEGIYGDRILPIERSICRIWGELAATRSRPVIDTLIAATAIHHGLTLVTRNTRDVEDIPVQKLNPWLL